jgi:dTDP-glucose 4,6-dehydratase
MTGAYGFIGSNVVHFLLDSVPDARVVAVDNLGFAANPANLDGVRDRIDAVQADIADPAAMQAAYEQFRPDYVVNFAAESHNDRAIVDPSSFMRANALGAQVLLECSRRNPVRTHLRPRRAATRSSGPTCRRTRRWTSG